MAGLVEYLTVWNPTDWRIWPALAVPIEHHGETIGQVRRKVADLYGVAPEQIELRYREQVLDNDAATLADYGLVRYAYVEARTKA
jgi:hypothetical protein